MSRPFFGQMFEDAEVEVGLLERSPGGRVFAIASGGCTALSLLSRQVEAIDAIDANPAQVALLEQKARVFHHEPYQTVVASVLALNRSGRMDRFLSNGRLLFRALVHSQRQIDTLLRQEDASEYYRTVWNTTAWRLIFSLACSRSALGRIFDRGYTRQLPRGFADLMRQRVEDAILGTPPRLNPYLHQAFLGGFTAEVLPLYLQASSYTPIHDHTDRLHLHTADALTWLSAQPSNRYGCLVLSNILDLSTAENAVCLAEQVRRTACRDALVCIRFIFPPPAAISAALARHLRLDESETQAACRRDRSLFCKFIQVYRCSTD